MNLFSNIHIDDQSVLILFFAIHIVSLLFVCVVWYTNRVYKVNKALCMLIFAYLVMLLSVALMYLSGLSHTFVHPAYITLLNTVHATFWVVAIFIMLGVTYSKTFLTIINILNLAQNICFILFNINIFVVHALSSLLIAVILCYCAVSIIFNQDRKIKTGIWPIEITLFLSTLYFAIIGITHISQASNIASIFHSHGAVSFFLVVSFTLDTLLSLTILYLYFVNLLSEVKQSYCYDSLTGAYTRSHFIKLFEQKLLDIKRNKNKIALCMIDLDDFKQINDIHGHLIGDEVLSDFCKYFQNEIRNNDILGRYGGEEFILLLDYKDAKGAYKMCSRILKNMKDIKLSNKELSVTFSCGMVFIDHKNENSVLELISIADTRLYKAKAEGKNCIIQCMELKDNAISFSV